MKLKSRKGQTMVEYIIIVVLIAITLLTLVGFFGKAIAKKFSGATSALDEEVGAEAQDAYNDIGDDGTDVLKRLDESGNK
jgi:Flp pilus assembly pilin Flp